MDTFGKALETLLAKQDMSTILQIGAHDGFFYDPIYNIIQSFKNKTKLLLVEPQADVMTFLKRNYAFHQNVLFDTSVVGDGKQTMFYSIKPEYYESYFYPKEKPYPDIDVPAYVQATGISTANYETFMKHYRSFFHNQDIGFRETVCQTPKKTYTIEELLQKNNMPFDLDVLIIDAEGDDDHILYHNSWEKIKPKIILFEKMHLKATAEKKIIHFLSQHDYQCTDLTEHILAIVP